MLLSAVDDSIFQYIKPVYFVTHIDKEKSNSFHYLKINMTLELVYIKNSYQLNSNPQTFIRH